MARGKEPRRDARQRPRAHPWAHPADVHCVAACGRVRLAEEIDRAHGRHLAADGGAVFGTLTTMPHDAGIGARARLGRGLGRVGCARGAAPPQGPARAFRLAGCVRSVEVTHGRAGWHPHPHVLLFTEAPLDRDKLRELHGYLSERWSRRILAAGLRSRTRIAVCACSRSTARTAWAGYLSKVGDEGRETYGRQERTDEELDGEAEGAKTVAVFEAEVWLVVVRKGLNVAVLAAVEARALGGLVVLFACGRPRRRRPS